MREQHPIYVSRYGAPNIRSGGQVDIQRWNPGERRLRAAKAGGLFLGLAAAAIFIPILHFVLVPGFLLALPYASLWVYRQSSQVSGGSFECPECKKTSALPKTKEVWPLNGICDQCRVPVVMTMQVT